MKKKQIIIMFLCICLWFPFAIIVDILISHQITHGIPVIGYHGVVNDDEKQQKYANNPYFLSQTQFEKHMKYLYDNNFQTLSMKDIDDYYYKKKDFHKKSVALTFDDGYLNCKTIVEPILKKYHFQATCFVIGQHINDNHPLFLKEKDIHNNAYLCYYSHSYNLHRKAPGIDKKIIETLSLQQISQDFQNSSVDHTYFAYPYGRSVPQIKSVLRKNNVRLAFSYNQFHHLTRQDDWDYLPRYMILDWMPQTYFQWIVKK